MHTKKVYILLIIFLIILLLTGCSKTSIKKTTTQNEPNKLNESYEFSQLLFGHLTADAKFYSLGSQYCWIALENLSPSPYTDLLLTNDGGKSWTLATIKDMQISSMQFINSENGWAVGYNRTPDKINDYIISTTDGGKTWSNLLKIEVSNNFPAPQIQFLNTNDGFILINGKISKTTNGGQSWEPLNSISNPKSFDFINSTEGWATTLDSIVSTIDGGKTWVKEWTIPSDIKEKLRPVISKIIAEPALGYWATFSGESTSSQSGKIILHKDTSNQWTIESGCYLGRFFPGKAALSDQGDLAPTSTSSALWIGFEYTKYPYIIFKTNDDGKTWSQIINGRPNGFPNTPNSTLIRMYFANNQLGWGIYKTKDTITILKSENGGLEWQTSKQIMKAS